MKITELEPEFIRFVDKAGPDGTKECLQEVTTLAEAQGILFNCPKCSKSHSILIAFASRGVQSHQGTHSAGGIPTRWQVAGGIGLDDLTLTPSIDCTPSNPNCWHGFITNGVAT